MNFPRISLFGRTDGTMEPEEIDVQCSQAGMTAESKEVAVKHVKAGHFIGTLTRELGLVKWALRDGVKLAALESPIRRVAR